MAAAIAGALVAINDHPDPAMDGIRTPQKYAALAQDFHDSAWEHLEKDDLAQASNKAWGLVAETVKDISAQHGRIIHTHRGIVAAIVGLRRLVANTGDLATARRITGIFQIARDLHTNFYEDELPEVIVRDGLIQCEELCELLYTRFTVAGIAPASGV